MDSEMLSFSCFLDYMEAGEDTHKISPRLINLCCLFVPLLFRENLLGIVQARLQTKYPQGYF